MTKIKYLQPLKFNIIEIKLGDLRHVGNKGLGSDANESSFLFWSVILFEKTQQINRVSKSILITLDLSLRKLVQFSKLSV